MSLEIDETEPQYTIIENNLTTEIKYVYHISDIHVRRFEHKNKHRQIEYNEVFDRLYKKIKLQIGTLKHKSIIILTGDIAVIMIV